jgi:3-oxoacyl-[acyl-carrier protein] reductase
MKKVMIIGASNGIGREIHKLLNNSFECFISVQNLNKYMEKYKEIYSDYSSESNFKNIIELDFAKQQQMRLNEFQTYVLSELDTLPNDIDILINNAGVATFSDFAKNTLEDFDRQVQINIIPSFIITQYFLRKMIENNSGVIINISSISTKIAFQNSAVYSATKSAVAAMMNSIREENRSNNIKITNLFLGATKTGIWSKEMQENFGYKMINPESVGKLVKSIVDLSQISDFMLEELIVRPQLGDL